MNVITGLQTTMYTTGNTGDYTNSKSGDGKTDNAKSGDATSAADKNKDIKIQQAILKLQQTENKVRTHEAAHMSAGGAYAGAANYQTTVGPDGRTYITGGEVSIDISTDKDPKKTVSKMEQVIRAAMAPADPSPQDYSVAAAASSIMLKATFEANKETKGQLIDIPV